MKLHYIGNGKQVIFLHGWGSNILMYKKFVQELGKYFKCLYFDLPGFGENYNLNKPYRLIDYVKELDKIIKTNNIKNPILIGHSFGGKIALKYALSYPNNIKILILFAPSGIISLKDKIFADLKIISSKIIKILLPFKIKKIIWKKFQKLDYYQIIENDILKKTFRNILKENFKKNELKKIDVPTLIFWGKQDKVLNYKKGIKLNKILPNSKLKIIKEGHFLNFENYVKDIIEFIQKNY